MDDGVWVAFLRGMNLGRRRLTNDELRDAVSTCGAADVRTYQASGNVVFHDGRDEEGVAAALAGLEDVLGYPVPVFLRTAAEVREVAAVAAFGAAELRASRGKPQVVFLHERLEDDQVDAVSALVPPGDVLVPAGRELHWLPAAGLGDNDLDLRRLDAIVGGTTVRTHGTVQRLAARFL